MGNAGSAHNLHNDCVESELNSYCKQQGLRRTTGERRKKYNQAIVGGWSSGTNIADCRVLPKPTENLKLRATTNGAILQAGGTISFRAKEQGDLERKYKPTTFHPMRRCHTLILDGQNDTTSHRKSAPVPAEFRRSQTLLHVGYGRTKSQDNVSGNFECPPQLPAHNITSTLKVNKYNKKRKAPPAPTKAGDAANAGQNLLPADTNSQSIAKPRIYTSKTNKAPITQKQLQSPTMNIVPFHRNSNTRTSANSSRTIKQSNPPYSSRLPYRREKSFDAKILGQRGTNDFSGEKRELLPNVNKLEDKSDRSVNDGKKKNPKQEDNVNENSNSTTFVNTYRSEENYLRDRHKEQKRLRQGETTQFNLRKDSKSNDDVTDTTVANERKTKYQQSRIPQLKRTFYFGMESSNNKSLSPNLLPTQNVTRSSEKMMEENEEAMFLSHTIEAEEEIVDNGLCVHVRPTLPRRQPKAPSFSPMSAWRNLMEEQQYLQLKRLKPTLNISNSRDVESPICLTSHAKKCYLPLNANWTPQQDLEDDDDDDDDNEDENVEELKYKTAEKMTGKSDKEPERCTNSLHVFSLSLPRDVHLQCSEQEANLKATNCWLVPGFSSLQKLKAQLGKSIDLRLDPKYTCAPQTAFKRNSYQLQNIFADASAAESKSTHQPDCDLNKTSLRRTSYKNDNWLLHKSKPNDTSLANACKILDDNSIKNTLSLSNLQPKSLTNICGGKHVVYLPGQDAFNDSTKDDHKNSKQTKTAKSVYTRQRHRQEVVRQSLQDLPPIQNIQQSNVGPTEKSTHRFSFQSTVRVLEKRRLAEKLSKDAEIQEAQRLNELEAMKRVEEDFQRKRAPEKANLRNQLRLHLKANAENGEYTSLPLNINERDNNSRQDEQHISDVNNNIFCRAEPDGAVSPSLDFNDNLSKLRYSHFPLSTAKSSKELDCFESNGHESGSETQLLDLHCTALLIEPYLHSLV